MDTCASDPLPFEPDISKAQTPPAPFYLDGGRFEAEKDRVFGRTWQWAGHASDVAKPGDFLASEIAGEPLVLVRDAGGGLRAFSNVCRHRGSIVACGKGNRRSLQCPYHGWTYGLDGALLAAPEFDGVRDFDKASVRLPPFRAETWGPFAFANLSTEGPALPEVLAGIPDEIARLRCDLSRLRFHSRKDYPVRCNWKVYVDNFLEGYHVPTAHPSLLRELDMDRYRVDTFRFHSSQFAPLKPGKVGESRRYGGPDAGAGALYYWVFPNWMLNVYPDNLSLNVVLPLGPEECLVVFEWYFFEGTQDLERTAEKTIAFSDEIQREDMEICERVQRGLRSSRYTRGRYSIRRENGVHHFHGLVHEFLAGEARDRTPR
jgi:phenylpropionate dioxygenase-like ring-hydroxylating dioxygenase large terminal subunit